MSLILERQMEEREWAVQDLADSDAELPVELQGGWRVRACWAGVVRLPLNAEDSSIHADASEQREGSSDEGLPL